MKPRTRRAIFNAKVAKTAIEISKRENDGMFVKYSKFRKLYRLFKAKLIKKYTARAATEVRRNMARNN